MPSENYHELLVVPCSIYYQRELSEDTHCKNLFSDWIKLCIGAPVILTIFVCWSGVIMPL